VKQLRFCAGLKVSLLAVCLPLFAAAQVPTAPATPPPANPATPAPPPYLSPEIHPDNTVTLRLRAPNAQKVDLILEGAVTPMQQDTDGLWAATTPVLAPEIYGYRFVVDGTPILDPRNTDVRNNLQSLWSNLTVPGHAAGAMGTAVHSARHRRAPFLHLAGGAGSAQQPKRLLRLHATRL